MPRAARSSLFAADDEVRTILRSNPIAATSFRPPAPRPSSRESLSRGAGARPGYGRSLYRQYPVPAYSACDKGSFPGVVVRSMPDSGVRHAVFTCSVGGTHYMFNPNDSREFDPDLPFDGFHKAEFHKYNRPMMQRDHQIELTWNPAKGECYEFAQNLSQFWHHRTHAGLSAKQQQALFNHMTSVCCGALSTREFADRLWQFELP